MRGSHSEETKKKISIANKGRKHGPDCFHCKQLKQLRKPHSEETRRKMSESAMGHGFSVETRKKMSETRKGMSAPWVTERLLGTKHPPDCQHCADLKERNRGRSLPSDIRIANRKRSSRACRIKAKYGISLETYDIMLIHQKNVCAICRQPCRSGKNLAVDHNHQTGKVRGLLCEHCNRAIGLFRENIVTLQNAINYLNRSETCL